MSDAESKERSPAGQQQVFGHREAERLLAQAAGSGRLAHAWLFCGPEGIGKASLAYRFARYLLCGHRSPSAESLDSPGQDPNSREFRLVAGDAHPDLLTVRRPEAGEGGSRSAKRPLDLPVEQVRKIPSFLSLSASEGGWRIVIVDEADRLNRNSANALLKVLEEPPERTLLVLVTVTPGRLVPTIRSRCRRLDLRRLSDDDMDEWLEQSGLQISADDRKTLVKLSNGSPGRLCRLLENDALSTARQLDEILAESGSMDWSAIHKLSENLARPTADANFELTVQMLSDRLEAAIRDSARGRENVNRGIVTSAEGTAQLDRLMQVWDKARDLFAAAKFANLDKRTVLIQFFAALEGAAKAR